MRVHHNNLVNLAGYCDEKKHLALVYEFMENRDLKEHLSGKNISPFTYMLVCIYFFNVDK